MVAKSKKFAKAPGTKSAKKVPKKKAKAVAPPVATAPVEQVAGGILAWEDDPFAATVPTPVNSTPIRRPVPDLSSGKLLARIVEKAPAPKEYPAGTSEFRYWAAADALKRGLDFWTGLLPSGTQWFSTIGERLQVELDRGADLNAYYTRRGLEFYHANIGGRVVFSGESPDIVCHELGHAVLDALRPQLFNIASIESAAFHESFGDMSALLVALQLPSVRERTLLQAEGRIYRTSRLSRLAEQLGWAIRQIRPDAAEPDALRNAVNSFFYTDPAKLPPDAPASQLSSRPHSFSRVFTGAFFEALGGMLLVLGPTEPNLLRASHDAGQLLVEAIQSAPIVPAYFSQVAAAIIDADRTQFNGLYRDALKSAFVRHGVLSLAAAAAKAASPLVGVAAVAADTVAPKAKDEAELPITEIVAATFGLKEKTLFVHAPSEPVRFPLAFGAAPDLGEIPSHGQAEDAQFFLEDLFRRGRVNLGEHGDEEVRISHPFAKKTHELVRQKGALVLHRLRFDCGFDGE